MKFHRFLLLAALLFFSGCDSRTDSAKVVQEILAMADVQVNGSRPWDIQVKNEQFYQRVLKENSLGLGESYMEGWWDAQALDQMMFRVQRAYLDNKLKMTWGMRWAVIKAKFFNAQTKSGSLKVIDQHYQLGNDLFERMLDKLMTYSCGYWRKATTLDEAQKAKYDLIARKLGLKPGMRVLDIGCGWGGFAKFIAQNYGVHVVGITLSENQAEYARRVCQDMTVEIRVQDYRDVREQFDRVVEIGMFEHVGKKNYRTFMEMVNRCLKDDGLFMLHTVGRNNTNVLDPWVERYIFPNAHLPSIKEIGVAIEDLFVMEDWHNFSTDYDKTLLAWFANFDARWPEIKADYPDQFYRMWKYYLLACAGAFRARNLQLWQVVLSKKGLLERYESVR